MTVLFFSRLGLYLLAFLLPVIHPSVAVSYDAVGWCLWFFLVPAQMVVAHFAAPPRLKARQWLLLGAAVLVAAEAFIVWKTGLSEMALLGLGVGLAAFVITALIFRGGERWAPLAVLEEFFLAWLYYRMLNFSRASEEIAASSSGLAQIIFVATIASLLAHGVVLYLALFRGSGKRGRREIALFAGIVAPLLLLVILVLPPDFVENSVIANRLANEPDPDLVPLDGWTNGLDNGNLRSNRDGSRNGDGQTGTPRERGQGILEGIPSDQWSDRLGQGQQGGEGSMRGSNQGQGEGESQGEGQGEGEARQYTVMIVASSHSPIYAATAYRGHLDAVQGFSLSPEEPLNGLTFRRLLETWVDPEPTFDAGRTETPVYTLSTIPDRTLAYRPSSVEPTVLDRQFHPLDYSFRAVSAISTTRPEGFAQIGDLSSQTRASMAEYLEVDLDSEARQTFQAYLDGTLSSATGYYERIDAILRGFSSYQYEIGYEEDVSIGKMVEFLTSTKNGDCTEFSNTAGILGRLAGIPSRVVVGYLASRDLQTDAHRQGLFVLRQMIEPLQAFDPEDLYLVTNAHRHSWVQYYMPGYGWVDFETTAFAIPPIGLGDANNRNVVIPIIEPQANPRETRPFPWLLLVKSLGVLVGAGAVGLYVFRYGREALLAALARRQDGHGLRSLQRLLLMRLATDGYTLKQPWETTLEYADRQPETREFATLYTELRYRQPGAFQDGPWQRIQRAYRETLHRCRRRGPAAAARRAVSLRPLHY
jgi:transglutaminase-like putative cysteine protease